MVSPSFTLVALIGAALAVPYAMHAAGSTRSRRWFGIGLSIAALLYVIMAAVRGTSESLGLELGGWVLFSAAAWVGVVWVPAVLAAAWALHVGWDLWLHPVHASGYAPWWYPVFCIGFDFFVAGFLMANIRYHPVHLSGTREPKPKCEQRRCELASSGDELGDHGATTREP